MFDTDQRLVMANSRVEWLLNARLSGHVGQRLPTLIRRLIPTVGREGPFDPREVRRLLSEITANPNAITRRRYLVHLPNGRAIEEISKPVLSDRHELLGRTFILRDITQERELESYRAELSEMLVHDLRSPLGGVITGLHALLGDVDTAPPAPGCRG